MNIPQNILFNPSPKEIPDQTGNSGRVLSTDGVNAFWGNIVDELPPQTSHGGKYLTTDGTNVSWVNIPGTTTFQPSATFEAYNDFASAIGQFSTTISGTNAVVSFSAVGDVGGRPGIAQLQTGTTSTGRAAIHLQSVSMLLGYGPTNFETAFRVPILSDGTETFTLRAGFIDSQSVESTDGIFLRYTDSVNSGKFEIVSRSNGAESVADSGVTVAAGTWYKLRIEVNATASSALVYINDVLRATITTNIPTGASRNTGIGIFVLKSNGTTSRNIDTDYMWIRTDFTTPR